MLRLLFLFLFVFFWLLLITFKQILAFVKVSLGTHLSLISASSTCYRSLTVISCCWPSSIWRCTWLITKIVEIIEHQIHVFLFVLLQMMYDSLIFVNFNSNMSIGLARYCTGFHEVCALILIEIITALNCRHFWWHMILIHHLLIIILRTTIQLLLSSTHWFIIKLATLFL